MLKRYVLAAVAVATLATGAQAGSDGFKRERYSEPGRDWFVDYVPEANTCIVSRTYSRGTLLQVTYLPKYNAFMLGLFNSDWTGVKADATYKLQFSMDGGADRWEGDFKGMWTHDSMPGFAGVPLSKAFITSLMKRNRVDIYNGANGNGVTALPLDGSAAAVADLAECLDKHDSFKDDAPAPPQRQQKPQSREFQS